MSVDKCTTEDFDTRVPDIIFDAFNGDSALINAMHPANMTREGRDKASVFFKTLAQNPAQHWVKYTDSAGVVTGAAQFAVFNHLDTGRIPIMGIKGPPGNWSSTEDEEWTQCLYRSLIENRNTVLSGSPKALVCLLKTCVLPAYQKQGVGTLLVAWGMQLADSLGAEMTVESTTQGRRLYEAQGFKSHHLAELSVPAEHDQRPKQTLVFMHRPAIAKAG